jgi:peptide/nickel transport system substrate-binding protein
MRRPRSFDERSARTRRSSRAVAAAIALALLAASCGGDDDSADDADTATTSAPSTSGDDAVTTPPSASGTPGTDPADAPVGGTLTYATVGNPATDTMDPTKWLTPFDIAVSSLVYDTLTRIDTDGSVTMALAESMTPNDDASEWTITLRPGVTFHDGSPLTADDVLYSLQRVQENQFQGFVAYGIVDLSKSEAVDDLTIHAVLTRPSFLLPQYVADIAGGIVKAGATDFTAPIGTGPFMFDAFAPGESATLTRNASYWQAGRPHVDELRLVEINDPSAAVNALLAGEIDGTDIPFTAADQVTSAGLDVVAGGRGAAGNFYLRLDQTPFDDPRVVEAMKLAIDREQCVDVGLLGNGDVGNDLFGATSPSYNSKVEQRTYDPERAKALLAEAGQSDLTVELIAAPAAPGMMECAQVFQQSAAAAGITITINEVDAGELYNPATFYLSATFGMTQWAGQSFEATTQGALLSDSPFNETHHVDPAFDAAFWAMEATADPADRQRQADEIQQELWDTGGYIIWGYADTLSGFSARVGGTEAFEAPSTGFHFDELADVWIDEG